MIKTIDYDVVGSYNNQRVSSIDAERSVNLFEYVDALGKKPKSLISTSGLINTGYVFDNGSGPITGVFRAQFVFNNAYYNVIGSFVFKIDNLGVIDFIGTISNDVGFVGVDANTFQVIFVNGQNGYIYDTIANTFTTITDTSFPPAPIDVCNLDGFFVVANGNTNIFNLSSFDQGLVWGPASNLFTVPTADTLTIGASTIGGSSGTPNFQTGVTFTVDVSSGGTLPTGLAPDTTYYAIFVDATHIKVANSYANAIAGTFITITASSGTGTFTILSDGQLQQAEITSHPGNIVACRTLHRKLFLFSLNYTEVWENAGIGTTLPFRRNNSLLMEYGTPAIGSISTSFDMMIFLSQTKDGLGAVMQVMGTESATISTRALDFQLSQYAAVGQIADCRGFLIKENGIIFYRMNFTAANHTFVYDVTLSNPQAEESRLWHEEEVLNGDRHLAQTHAYFNGINYVGSYKSPILYKLDSATYTNDNESIRRMRITKAFVPPGYQRLRIDRLQLDLLQGNRPASIVTPEILLTETGFPIETESEIDILLEQGVITFNTDNLFVFLSISKDGGQTYGNSDSSPMGNIGQRTFRTVWRKKGVIPRGQAFVAKFEFFQAVPFIILGGSWAVDILPE